MKKVKLISVLFFTNLVVFFLISCNSGAVVPIETPLMIQLLTPANNATNQDTSLNLTWEATAGNTEITGRRQAGTISGYTLNFVPDGQNYGTPTNHVVKSVEILALDYSTTYKWVVAVHQLDGKTATSTEYHFTTKPIPPVQYTITVRSSPTNGGDVRVNSSTWGDDQSVIVTAGAPVTVEASPASGWSFEGWYIGSTKVNQNQTYVFNASTNDTYKANFIENPPQESQTLKILVLNFDPILETRGNIRLHQIEPWWNDPRSLRDEFIQDFKDFTNNYIQKEVVEWIDLDEWPRRVDGYRFTDAIFLNYYENKNFPNPSYGNPNEWLDYEYYIDLFDLESRVNAGEIDQVWFLGPPYTGGMGFESRMIGDGAYWCNSPGIQRDCKPFIIYYFNYERGTDCMLENVGHAMESIMAYVYQRWDTAVPIENMNKWERFTLYDKVSPGNAACGNVHFAPNSKSDYDWGNLSMVWTTYLDWENYPNLTGIKKYTNTADWGNGDMRLHHKWWFSLFPKIPGKDEQGYFHNWWKYYVSPTEK